MLMKNVMNDRVKKNWISKKQLLLKPKENSVSNPVVHYIEKRVGAAG